MNYKVICLGVVLASVKVMAAGHGLPQSSTTVGLRSTMPIDTCAMVAMDRTEYQAVIPLFQPDREAMSASEVGLKRSGRFYLDQFAKSVRWKWAKSRTDLDQLHSVPLPNVRVQRARNSFVESQGPTEPTILFQLDDDDNPDLPVLAAPEPMMSLSFAAFLPLLLKKRRLNRAMTN